MFAIKVFSLVGDDTVVPVVTKDVTLLVLTVLCTFDCVVVSV